MASDPTGLFLRLYLDEDVHARVARALRLRHFDVLSAHEGGWLGLSDTAQLTRAVETGRTLLTFNIADYLALHLNWLNAGRTHHGIIVSDQLPIGETMRRLLNLLNRVTSEDARDQLLWLQAFK